MQIKSKRQKRYSGRRIFKIGSTSLRTQGASPYGRRESLPMNEGNMSLRAEGTLHLERGMVVHPERGAVVHPEQG